MVAFLGFGIMGVIFTLLWIAMFPRDLLEAITFQNASERKWSVLIVVYIVGSIVATIVGLNALSA